MTKTYIKNEKKFFEILDKKHSEAAEITTKLSAIFKARRKLYLYTVNGPTYWDEKEGVTKEALEKRVKTKERSFMKYMIDLSHANGYFMRYIEEKDIDILIEEISMFANAARVADAFFKTA